MDSPVRGSALRGKAGLKNMPGRNRDAADQKNHGCRGHALVQSAHLVHVEGVGTVMDSAHAQKQQAFEDRMVQAVDQRSH